MDQGGNICVGLMHVLLCLQWCVPWKFASGILLELRTEVSGLPVRVLHYLPSKGMEGGSGP